MSFANDTTARRPGLTTTHKIMSVLAFIGLVLSVYLTYEHFTNASSMICSASGAVDCVRVTTSSYSMLFGVSVAVLGLVFYVVALAMCLVPRANAAIRWVRVGLFASGLVMVLYLIWAEMQVGAICLWCSGVHLVTLVLLVMSLVDAIVSED